MKNELETNLINTNLSFMLDREVFATDVQNVLEILEVKPVTRVPKSPEYILGVINLRGAVLPVVDLRRIFGLPPVEITEDTCIIVLSIDIEGERITLGALVDSVSEVLEIPMDNIEPAPNIGNNYKADFLSGMWRKDDEFIMLLDVNNIFASEELSHLRESVENLHETVET